MTLSRVSATSSRKWLAKTQSKQSKLVIWVELGSELRREDEWGALDNVLMRSPEVWPVLREVSLSIFIMKYHDSRMDDSDLEDALERLSET